MTSTLSRRQALAFALAAGLAAPAAGAASGIGAVLLHGKGGRPPRGPLRAVSEGLRTAWVDVREPTLPWAESRYIEGSWNDALGEIGGEVAALRRGSAKVVLVGQSLGACAALSYAARRRDPQALVDALCLISPGHLPSQWVKKGGAVRDSIEEARALVASGKGVEVRGFNDENQGKALTARMRADAYLSYFDPEGDAEMPRMAPLVPNIPVLYVVGTGDPGLAWGKPSVFDRLPANPRSRYVEVSGDHFSAGSAAADTIVGWVKGLA